VRGPGRGYRLWAALTAEGESEIMCGWLRDRWGVPWQIVPEVLPRLLADSNPDVSAPRLYRDAGHGGSWT
jgi:predicted 3-demethylubiquinone-9 3-methyltransferase (glyoxalase superfamily)